MEVKRVRNEKLYMLVMLIIGILLALGNKSLAETKEYKKTIIGKSGMTDIVGQVDLEIQENGRVYEYSSFIEEKIEAEKKTQKQTTEEREFSFASKLYLDEYFNNTILYEDEKYKGDLNLVDYNVKTVDNGFYEKIDSKEIVLTNMPTNDLSQVEKNKIINNRSYVLINVKWIAEENEEIDSTLVPKKYKGIANYQSIVRIKNPDTYKVTANYEGEVEEKEQLSNYTIIYKLKEQQIDEKNNIVPYVIIIAGGILALGILILLFKPNATIYNVQNRYKLVKIQSVRLKNRKLIDITNKQNIISGNNFVIQINNSTFDKLLNSEVIIKLNSQNKKVIITSTKTRFYF